MKYILNESEYQEYMDLKYGDTVSSHVRSDYVREQPPEEIMRKYPSSCGYIHIGGIWIGLDTNGKYGCCTNLYQY